MVDIRGFNGGLNTDSALELLPNGAYTYAMNISNGSEGITNLPGNVVIPNLPPPEGNSTEWICGSFFDKKRQRVILFTNHERGYHRILSYDITSELYTILFEQTFDANGNITIFNWTRYPQFNPDGLIKDIKVVHRENEGDLYYFISPDKKLYKFNYDKLLVLTNGDTTLCAYGWTSANYDGTTLRDGTPIPEVTSNSAWAALTTPAWCYYNNDPANGSIYGKLYNWYAVSHPLFAPVGYRVPTDSDWTNLVNCLGGESVAGGKMKSTSLWNAPNTGATNESLFNGFPGGRRSFDGPFYGIGDNGSWWSSTEFNTYDAWFRYLYYDNGAVSRANFDKASGYSVRLIKQ